MRLKRVLFSCHTTTSPKTTHAADVGTARFIVLNIGRVLRSWHSDTCLANGPRTNPERPEGTSPTTSTETSWEYSRVKMIELSVGVQHIYLVTEDENSRRVQHHFYEHGYESGLEAAALGYERKARRLGHTRKTAWLRNVWEKNIVTTKRYGIDGDARVSDIKEAMLKSGHYNLYTNNCIHAANRGLQMWNLPKVPWLQAALSASSVFWLTGGWVWILAFPLMLYDTSASTVLSQSEDNTMLTIPLSAIQWH